MIHIQTVFAAASEKGASDVHLVVGKPVLFRIDGELVPQGTDVLTNEDTAKAIAEVLGDFQMKRFEEHKEIDVSYALPSGVRLRVNCHYERGTMSMAARIIPESIPSLEELGLEQLQELCSGSSGLILFTGPTGAGKSTSLASMIEYINHTAGGNIITLEDPVEFLFSQGKGIVRQREFGSDFLSFPEALKRMLRQDPDIIMVGEMRDLETIAAALTLAETGHLVFATLHTPNAKQTIDRIVDVFPPHQQQQIRTQLSLSLKAVIAQRLIPKEGGGRIAHREVLINTPAVANIIRDNRIAEVTSVMQTGKTEGMLTFEKHAEELLKAGMISKETYEWAKEV